MLRPLDRVALDPRSASGIPTEGQPDLCGCTKGKLGLASGMVQLLSLRGSEILEHLEEIADLRISVFRDFPYLYDGDRDYERTYLGHFAESPEAFVVLALAEGRTVGAATSSPMEDHQEEFSSALATAGISVEGTYYCAESVLLPGFRGQGLGHSFFDLREAEARRLNCARVVFCAVVRPETHPARPDDYRPLDTFWRKRGYAPIQGAVAHFPWRDLGSSEESAKPMQFWGRQL